MTAFRKILLFCGFILFAVNAYAIPFNVVPAQPLPTSLYTGQTVNAYYTVSNNTGMRRNNNYVEYLPPNVRQVSSGGTFGDTCGSIFSLAPHGQAGSSCTLQLAVSGPVNAEDPDQSHHLFVCFPGGKTCAGTNYPLSVVENAVLSSIQLTPVNAAIFANGQQQYTAIAIYSDGVTQNVTNPATYTSSNPAAATIAPGGLASAVSGGQSTTIYAYYKGVKSNPATLNIMARAITSITVTPNPGNLRIGFTTQFNAIANYNDGTTTNVTTLGTWSSSVPAVATISPTTGLSTGVSLGVSNIMCTYQTMSSSAVAANVVRYSYYGGNGNVDYCQLSTSGVFTNCAGVSATGGLISSANSAGTFVYYGLATSLTYCAINTDGSLSSTSCGATSFQPSVYIQSMALSPSANVLYVPSGTDATVYSCPLNTTTGNTSSACVSNTVAGLTRASYVTVAPSGNFLYVLDGASTNIAYCQIIVNGTLGTCTAVGTGAYVVSGVTINPNGLWLYVLNSTGGNSCTIIPCSVNTTTGALSCSGGSAGLCSQAAGLAADPLGTYIYIGNSTSNASKCPVSNGTTGACSGVGPTFFQNSIR